MNVGRLGWFGVGALLGAACSTVKPDRVVSCMKTEDCRTGEVCQNGECYPNTLPPPEQIGLDVAVETLEGAFRVELPGADKIVERVVEQSPARFRARLNNAKDDAKKVLPGVRDRLRLSIVEQQTIVEEEKTKPLPASLILEQASRLRRDPVRGEGTYSPYDVDENEVLNAEVVVPWPRYDPADSADPLHLTIRPPFEEVDGNPIFRGTIHRQLMRKQEGEASIQVFAVPTRYECHRKIIGEIVVGDGAELDSRVSVDFVHTHSEPDPGKSVCDPSTAVQAVCEPSTVYPNVLPSCTTATGCPAPYGCYPSGDSKRCGCASDAECLPGQICELESHRCAYDLAGLSATNGAVTTAEGKASIEAWIYSYCDEDLEADREMAFLLRATAVGLDDGDETTPLPAANLPPLTFQATANVFASMANTLQLPGRLCFPNWDPPHDLTVEITSKPREVFRDDMDRPWICCSTDCLGMMLSEPPPVPTSCPLTAGLTPRTLYTPDEAQKDKHGCLELAAIDDAEAGSQWIVGTKVQLGACIDGGGSPAPCDIDLSAGDGSREYELRLEPAVGSLVRSTIYTAEVKPDSTALPAPELAYRVILRGGVALEVDPESEDSVCDSLTDCEVNAEVLAERIRVPGEDPATVVGPHFYTARTIEGSKTGEFVLPVNPGVYLLTALPAISSPGGPAKISVVDLRIGSKLVKMTGEIPTATLADPLVLPEKGQFVIFELAGFDLASVATPFDLGSWTGLSFEGRELDLNDPTTCHGDPGRACSIRRLRAGNSGLALTQEQFVKFITRAAPEP